MGIQHDPGKLDCLLISPPFFYEDEENIWKEVNSNFPPSGLAFLAAYIRERGSTVKVIDCNISAPSVQSFKSFFEREYAKKFPSIKVIGLTTATCTIKKAYRIAQICKEYYPDALIVFGGAHATSLPEEVIEKEFVDIVVVGEGEITLEEILKGKGLDKIKGIVFKKPKNKGFKVIKNPPRERITDLDSLPIPAYDLLPMKEYKPAKGTYKRLPAIGMMTSRGCPGRCTFCSKTLGNRLAFMSAEKILQEIEYLIKNYGIKEILFYDDTFTVFRNNVIKLCDMIAEKKIDISWTCFARVDFVDPELLKKMKKAGCHQIMYGVENINEAVLKNINKKINLNHVINATRWTKEAGIDSRLAFMVGNPGDTEEIIKENIRFVNRLNPDLLVVNITTPFPGTEMFNWAKEKNLILTYDWDDYTLAKPIMELENLNAEQIKNLYKLMYKSFYFRPSFIFKKLLSIKSIEDLRVLTDGFYALVSFFSWKKTKDSTIKN